MLTTNELDQLIVEYTDLTERRTVLDDRINQIKNELRDNLQLGTHHALGGAAKVTVSAPPVRFSADLAAQVLTPEQLHLVSETVVSSKRAKELLPPALYSACQAATSNGPTVRIS